MGGTPLTLTWDIHHDPADEPVTLNTNGDTLVVTDASRATGRWIILRATTGPSGSTTIVNDYRLYIPAGRGGLKNPGLRFATPVDTLGGSATHSFAATGDSSGAISYRVTRADGSTTDRATIDPVTGVLTAHGSGSVRVTATVAADAAYRGATTHHPLTLVLQPANLEFAPHNTILPRSVGAVTLTAVTDSPAPITWEISNPGIATLSGSGRTAILTPNPNAATTGSVEITARIAATDTHEGDSATTEIAINALQPPNLRFTDTVESLALQATHEFAATSDSGGAITWDVTQPDGTPTTLATIDADGLLTVTAVGTVEVTATLAAEGPWSGATLSQRVTLTLIPANLRFTASPLRLLTNQTTQFVAVREGNGDLTWSLLEEEPTASIDANGVVTAGATGERVTVQVEVAATATHTGETLRVPLEVTGRVDFDRDGLIEIYDLGMLHNMRYNRAGTSYKTAADVDGITTHCPDIGGCTGYELASDLDFDIDGDGTSWSGNITDGYTLDAGDSQAPWFDTAAGGWEPIGDIPLIGTALVRRSFTATLEGNGFVIRNLAIDRDQRIVGFLGLNDGPIRNLGLENGLATTSDSSADIGLLAGQTHFNPITASYATGVVAGGDTTGGLVGSVSVSIIASHADVAVYGDATSSASIGGLVGTLDSGEAIIASYATGAVTGLHRGDIVGGLVGSQGQAHIIASYATGAVTGISNSVGGLVGSVRNGSIAASYATGNVRTGRELVGGLIGARNNSLTLIASYATGNVSGGVGEDEVGALIGQRAPSNASSPIASYGFGTGTRDNGYGGSPFPTTEVTRASALTLANAGGHWNAAASGTLNAWDFGDDTQPPALRYGDYDGTSDDEDEDDNIDYCALFAAVNIQCGTLIPGQRDAHAPQIGTAPGDIRLAPGDTARHITGSVTLPTTFTVGDATHDIVWSVHHDSALNASRVRILNGRLLVDAEQRASTRWIVLRATSGDPAITLNDYRLRIIQTPNLRLVGTPAETLGIGAAHTFMARSDGSTPITWRVTDIDGSATERAPY